MIIPMYPPHSMSNSINSLSENHLKIIKTLSNIIDI